MKLFAFALMITESETSSTVTIEAGTCLAMSKDEALGKVLQSARERYPAAYRLDPTVAGTPDRFIRAAAAGLPSESP